MAHLPPLATIKKLQYIDGPYEYNSLDLNYKAQDKLSLTVGVNSWQRNYPVCLRHQFPTTLFRNSAPLLHLSSSPFSKVNSLPMDTLSSSVSSLTVPTLRRSSADFYHFKNPYTTSSSSPFSFPKPTSISKKTNSFTHKKTCSNFPFLSRNSPLKQPSSRHHQTPHTRASSGYAAALVEVANCNNSLEKLDKDVRRLSRWLRNDQLRALMTDPFVGNKEKGHVLEEILSKGKFNKHLVGVLKLLVDKNKLGIVDEVLMEFERIYDQLCGTQVVLVSSEVKLEKDKILGIAKKVQELSGTERVKVKVRNLVDDKKRSRSFAL